MRTTFYTCDKCKKEVKESRFLFQVKLLIDSQLIGIVEWCDNCVVAHGIVDWKQDNVKSPVPLLSIEDRIVMILDDLGFKRD